MTPWRHLLVLLSLLGLCAGSARAERVRDIDRPDATTGIRDLRDPLGAEQRQSTGPARAESRETHPARRHAPARLQEPWYEECLERLPPWAPGAALGLALLGGFFGWRGWRRYRPRHCPVCVDVQLVHLGELEEDAHLTPNQQTEERIGSMQHDVYTCPSCDHVEFLRTATLFSRYKRCPVCTAKTQSTRRMTLRRATKRSEGLVEIHETCRNCDYVHTYQKTTPMRPGD